jgi:hypothetical protein
VLTRKFIFALIEQWIWMSLGKFDGLRGSKSFLKTFVKLHGKCFDVFDRSSSAQAIEKDRVKQRKHRKRLAIKPNPLTQLASCCNRFSCFSHRSNVLCFTFTYRFVQVLSINGRVVKYLFFLTSHSPWPQIKICLKKAVSVDSKCLRERVAWKRSASYISNC